MYEFSVLKNTVLNQATVVCTCWLKLQKLKLLHNTTIKYHTQIIIQYSACLHFWLLAVYQITGLVRRITEEDSPTVVSIITSRLILYSTLVTACTACFNIKETLRLSYSMHLHISYDSQNKQQGFP
jgi:hypothetical protein